MSHKLRFEMLSLLFIQQIFIGHVSSVLVTELHLKPLMIKVLLGVERTNINKNLDK